MEKSVFYSLGSNFILKDKKLSVDLKDSIFIIKKNLKHIQADLIRFEPEIIKMGIDNVPTFKPVILKFLGDRDSNPD